MNKRIKVGLNGFGRIGRTIFRQLFSSNKFEIVHVNDIHPDIHNLCYLLNFDTMHGRFENDASVDSDFIVIGEKRVKVTHSPMITEAGWSESGVELLIESSGYKPNIPVIRDCLDETVKKVLFSDSPENMDITIANGVNEGEYSKDHHHIISSSICDVVGTAPILKIINDKFGIKNAFLQTLHPWLNYQNIMDGTLNQDVIKDPSGKAYGIGRASPNNLIPKNTTLGSALLKVIPDLKGKLSTMSYRVPTDVVGSCSMVIDLENKVTKDGVISYIQSAEKKPIIELSDDPIVSSDIKHHKSSCIVDMRWIDLLDNKLRIITWYDNEWGYVNRLCDNLERISS